MIKVPYCLRVTEEQKIYDKLVRGSELAASPCAPATLEMLARFSVLTRLRRHENSTLFAKMRVYDGESLKETDPRARSLQEYKDAAGVEEGMDGVSTRFAFKVLAATFNHDTTEIAADPVHLMYVLEQAIRREQLPTGDREALPGVHQGRARAALRRVHRQRDPEGLSRIVPRLRPEPVRPLRRPMPMPGSRTSTSRIPTPASCMNRELLNQELTKVEKPAGIANPKDFRNEVVKFSLRARANNNGKNPSWTSYEKIREVIERRMFSQVEELLPVISFGSKKDGDSEKKHEEFVERMVARGYTERQVRRLVEWYMRVKQAG